MVHLPAPERRFFNFSTWFLTFLVGTYNILRLPLKGIEEHPSTPQGIGEHPSTPHLVEGISFQRFV